MKSGKNTFKGFNGVRTLLLIILVVVVGSLGYTYLTSKNSKNCKQTLDRTNTLLQKAKSNTDIEEVNTILRKNNNCTVTSKDEKTQSSRERLLVELQYYHDLAVTDYRIGKVATSKSEAVQGLKTASYLSDTDKSKTSVRLLITELEYVKAGTY